MKILRKTEFGNRVLRETARYLTTKEIKSSDLQAFIKDMYYTLEKKKYGVGLAAPQVGMSIALSVIGIKPTPTRLELKAESLVVINPRIVEMYGRRQSMWEGCISGTELYAKVPRYKKIRMRWQDASAKWHERDFEGIMAHVLQHEVDHLNGILFVDKVKDTKSYMTITEYKKHKKQGNHH